MSQMNLQGLWASLGLSPNLVLPLPLQLPGIAAYYSPTSGFLTDGAASFASASSQSLSVAVALLPNGTNPFSVSMWFKPTNHAAKQGLWGGSFTAFANVRPLAFYETNQKVTLSADGTGTSVTSTTTLVDGTWNHLVFTFNGSTGQVVINNGVPKTGSLGADATTLTGFNIGRDSSTDVFTNGAISSFGVWNKVLSAGEITSLYNSGSGLAVTDFTGSLLTSLAGGYEFRSTTNLVKDYIGTNTLTNNNVVTYDVGQVSSGTLVDGDAVKQWTDASGLGNHLLQAGPGKRPLYKVSIQNGLPVIRGDGALSWMATAAAILSSSQNFTLAAVLAPRSASQRVLWDQGTGSSMSLECSSNLVDKFFVGNAGGVSGPANLANGTAVQVTEVDSATTLTLYHNGSAGTGGTSAGNTGTSTFSVLGRTNSTQQSQCDLGEFAAYSATLTVPQQQQLESYLRSKWNTP